MKLRTLIRRSLRFHWRSHLGVVLGAAIGSAALIGALVVGDSVRASLRKRASERIGGFDHALMTGDRFLGSNLVTALSLTPLWQPALQLSGVLATDNGRARANKVQLYGIQPTFWAYSPNGQRAFELEIEREWRSDSHQKFRTLLARFSNFLHISGSSRDHDFETFRSSLGRERDQFDRLSDWYNSPQPPISSNGPPEPIFINEPLAAQLGAKIGDLVTFRLAKPSMLSKESAIVARDGDSIALKFKVADIVLPGNFGLFELHQSQGLPLNAFVAPDAMPADLSLTEKANIVLVFGGEESDKAQLAEMIQSKWRLTDVQANLVEFKPADSVELRTGRVFLDPPIARTALAADTNGQPILTYLATLLRTGTNATPYSTVTAAGAPWTPVDLRDDEIVVSQWLAEDLKVKPGDEIALSYFLPESGAKLEEATNIFRVHSIVPMEMPWADRTLMPNFPGIEKAESTSEWDAGFPLTYKVRPKDDEYWKQHRGTPKAFITLAAGQKLWGNRFGNLTAIRFPIPTNSQPTTFRSELERKILANLKPEELGLRFEPVREQALRAAEGSQDFGGLFLGFSFFVIAAALLLMAMLFRFGLEQRAPEIGTLLALGFTPKQVRNLFLREGAMLALFGGILGAIGGIYFAKAMLHGLATVWRDAVGATALGFHFTGQTVVIGVLASVIISTLTIWLALRKFVKRTARELLVGEIGSEESKVKSLKSKIIAVGALLTALTLVGWAMATGDTANTGIFFGAGALVLIAGLSFASVWLVRLGGAPLSEPAHGHHDKKHAGPEAGAPITTVSLAIRGCVRRRKRSLGTMAMLACGSFLIVSIGVFRLDANRDATQKTSGTGGFALIGETTMPVVQDLNSASGRDFFALNEADAQGVSVVPFRVRQGDEASCLNLNAAQNPRLLGVNPEILEGRFGFAKGDAWKALRESAAHINQKGDQSRPLERSHEIAAIGDANSIQWAMKKKVGDTIDYVDERGQPFKVRIVGAVANSILQGQLIIDESEFVKRFPGESGYRMFLIDTPSNKVSEVSATLSRAMQDVGLELTPTVIRLNQFNAVQNTYLGTFQVLGGLGLLLGSVGLGIVVLRNVLERRSELALLLAVGFRKAEVQRLLLMENGTLLLAGLGVGILAAAVAVLPSVLTPSGQLPYASLSITLAAVLCNGALWTWVATRIAVRGDLLTALRNE